MVAYCFVSYLLTNEIQNGINIVQYFLSFSEISKYLLFSLYNKYSPTVFYVLLCIPYPLLSYHPSWFLLNLLLSFPLLSVGSSIHLSLPLPLTFFILVFPSHVAMPPCVACWWITVDVLSLTRWEISVALVKGSTLIHNTHSSTCVHLTPGMHSHPHLLLMRAQWRTCTPSPISLSVTLPPPTLFSLQVQSSANWYAGCMFFIFIIIPSAFPPCLFLSALLRFFLSSASLFFAFSFF